MEHKQNRWESDQVSVKMLRISLRLEAFGSADELREWFSSTAHRTIHYVSEESSFDYTYLCLSNCSLSDVSFSYDVLDHSNFSGTTFEKTGFQSCAAREVDFSGCTFLKAQMSPIYAHRANFSDCIFESCFLMGVGPRHHKNHLGDLVKGTYSDFRECNFTRAKVHKSYFLRSDFTDATFTDARFIECEFVAADLRGVHIAGTHFDHCDFDRAWLDDTPATRAAVLKGDNRNLDSIVWSVVQQPVQADSKNWMHGLLAKLKE